MLLLPPNFDELLLCVSLHLGLEGAEGSCGRTCLRPRGSQNCNSWKQKMLRYRKPATKTARHRTSARSVEGSLKSQISHGDGEQIQDKLWVACPAVPVEGSGGQ